jgi:hypothetical protein
MMRGDTMLKKGFYPKTVFLFFLLISQCIAYSISGTTGLEYGNFGLASPYSNHRPKGVSAGIQAQSSTGSKFDAGMKIKFGKMNRSQLFSQMPLNSAFSKFFQYEVYGLFNFYQTKFSICKTSFSIGPIVGILFEHIEWYDHPLFNQKISGEDKTTSITPGIEISACVMVRSFAINFGIDSEYETILKKKRMISGIERDFFPKNGFLFKPFLGIGFYKNKNSS